LRPYVENIQHKTEQVEGLKLYSACLASVRPSSNPSTAKKKKSEEEEMKVTYSLQTI
jgi:hypothetical protein